MGRAVCLAFACACASVSRASASSRFAVPIAVEPKVMMPVIAVFEDIITRMFFEDYDPPHVHAR